MTIELNLPVDATETSLAKARREAYEDHAKDEVPKLKNINAVLAFDYFKYGWDAAIAKYSKKPIEILAEKKEYTKSDFSQTNMQIATVMALNGTDKQKEEAREFLTAFLKGN